MNPNINITDNKHGELYMSEAANESLERHNRIIQHVETKKIARALQVRIPTNDDQVKYRLRVLGEPACYFAENAAGRRDRLRDVLTKMVSEGKHIPEFKDGTTHMDASMADLSAKRTAYWVEGERKTAKVRKKRRLELLHTSLERASKRIAAERGRRNTTQFEAADRMDQMETSLKSIVSQISVPADTRPLSTIKFDPTGTKIATGGRTGFAKIWDLDGNQIAVTKGHTDRISDLVWNPDTEAPLSFATGSCDSNIVLWKKDGAKLGMFPSHHTNRISKMVWHPNRKLFISTSFDKSWILWDVETRQPLVKQQGHDNSVYAVALHPDGSLVATSDLSGHIRLWDIRKGQQIWGMTKHVKQVLSLDFSPKGYQFASGSDDNTIKIWDLRKKVSPFAVAAHSHSITCVKFEPTNGDYVVSTSKDKSIKFWNGKRFSLVHTAYGHEDPICMADVHPKKMLFATASFDRTFKIWGPEVVDTKMGI